jgi:hypothetical protein
MNRAVDADRESRAIQEFVRRDVAAVIEDLGYGRPETRGSYVTGNVVLSRSEARRIARVLVESGLV